MTETMTYRQALHLAHKEALAADDRVLVMGEDVGLYGGSYAVTKGLLDEFGPEKIIDTPICESGFVGAAIGAAAGGLKPIVEVMTVNFALLALDQIVNNAATLYHMSGGQFNIPLVIRMATGAGKQLAAQHSHSFEGWMAHIPGLKILTPATVTDARYMLRDALLDPNPVLMFEHAGLYNAEGELGDDPGKGQSFKATARRQGRDISLFTYGGCLQRTLDAADQLQQKGLDAEVIDLRCLRPLDDKTIIESVKRTSRAMIIEESWKSVGLASEVMARIMEQAFYDLDAPVARVCGKEVPVPYAKHMEDAAIPQVEDIVEAALKMKGD